MKTVGVTDYTNQTHLRISDGKMSKFNAPRKMRKYLSDVYQYRDVHFQCVNNHFATFEYKEMKSVGVTDYTHHLSIFDRKMSEFNTP